MRADWPGTCTKCHNVYIKGSDIVKTRRGYAHRTCAEVDDE